MGKRSDFSRIDRDFYPTPYEAVAPLLPHLKPRLRFVEPCCGNGLLIQHLEKHGHLCVSASDIADYGPNRDGMTSGVRDALSITSCGVGDCFITNPPWSRPVLHRLISHLSGIAPTWLLFDAAWAHTRQAAPLLPYCTDIVSVGRVKWIPGTTMSGKDDAAWYRFVSVAAPRTVFHGRIVP